MMFLYDIPQWVMGVLIVGTCVATIVTAYLFTRNRMGHAVFTDTQVGAALSFLGVMATVTALLLAFTAVSVWESFSTAETAVVNEANEAAELARDLAVYGPVAVPAREAVREYVLLAVDVEWPLMASASSSVTEKSCSSVLRFL